MKQTYNVLNALMNRVLWVVLIGDDMASIFIDKCSESFRYDEATGKFNLAEDWL
jgi:hypothetical protein